MNSYEEARTEVGRIATELEDLAERFSEASTGLRGQREDVQAAERGFKKLATLLRTIAGEQPERELNRRRLADAPWPGADAKIATELEDLAERFSEASTGLRGQREDVQAAERGFKKLAALLRTIAGEQPECELPRRLADAPDPGADAQGVGDELA